MAQETGLPVVIPGDTIANQKSQPGRGTYGSAGAVKASLLGQTLAHKPNTASPFSSIQRPRTKTPAILPAVGDAILGIVVRIGPRQASIEIVAVTSLSDPAATMNLPYRHQALVRQQDIRATEIDKVTVSGSFKVGDLIRGTVISIGDERNYYVSTAGDAMGVVLGRSDLGEDLVGINWREMIDSKGRSESRKAAKVV